MKSLSVSETCVRVVYCSQREQIERRIQEREFGRDGKVRLISFLPREESDTNFHSRCIRKYPNGDQYFGDMAGGTPEGEERQVIVWSLTP